MICRPSNAKPFQTFFKKTPSPTQLNRKQCLQTLVISHQEAGKSKQVHIGTELNLTAVLLLGKQQYDQREVVKRPPFVKPSLIVSKNPSQKNLLRTDGNQWHGLSLQEASCGLPGASAPGAVFGQWPSDTAWTCWAKPHWQRTSLLHCPSPARKAEEEEANLPHALQDLLEKWVTAKGWPASMNTQKIPENVYM